jgi:hypothetical protein
MADISAGPVKTGRRNGRRKQGLHSLTVSNHEKTFLAQYGFFDRYGSDGEGHPAYSITGNTPHVDGGESIVGSSS